MGSCVSMIKSVFPIEISCNKPHFASECLQAVEFRTTCCNCVCSTSLEDEYEGEERERSGEEDDTPRANGESGTASTAQSSDDGSGSCFDLIGYPHLFGR